MKLVVRLFAVLRERAGTGEIALDDLPDDLDVAGLKRELERRRPELGALARVAGAVGTDYVADSTTLADGDVVCLLPPVSGGSDRGGDDALARGVFELVPEPLDPAAALARVAHASCGGTALFVGTTRAANRGQPVVRLDYEAFEAMTGPEMQRIFERCRAALDTGGDPERKLRMLCQHRTGTVAVGEPSVVVAVASPHRAAAFEACRFLIDALKESLPVWKKEVYEDGHHWIGERS
jgi:molybdopterin synthase catalytic subunit